MRFQQAHRLGCDVQSFNFLTKVKTFPEGFYPNQMIISILEQEVSVKKQVFLNPYMPAVN